MVAESVQDGNSVDYTPAADVAAGDVVVLGELVGVAPRPIKAGENGSLAVVGIFAFPKTVGAGSGLAFGVKVYWDAVAKVVTATVGANKYVGKTVQAAADSDAAVRTRLCP